MKIGKTKGKTIVIDLGLVLAVLFVVLLALLVDFGIILLVWKIFNLS